MHKNEVEIVVIAKLPKPGKAKTRLIPALGPQGAADMADKLLRHTMKKLEELLHRDPSMTVTFCVSPDVNDAYWLEIIAERPFNLLQQIDGDLGEKMLNEVERVCHAAPIILIGTDCPGITSDLLLEVKSYLTQYDMVIAPAEDGGYTLLAVNVSHPSLFENISWSTSTVFEDTMARAKKLGLKTHVMPMMFDIDVPDDLKKLSSQGLW